MARVLPRRRLRSVAVAVSLLMAVEAAVVVSTSGHAVALSEKAASKGAEAAEPPKELGPATADSESAARSWSCTPKGWDVWTAGQAGTGTHWTNQPSWGSKQATSTQTKGFSSACNDGWVNADVTAMVKSWAANGNGSNHLGLRASDEGDAYGWKRFNSGNAASRTPYLSVTYNSIPGVPTLVAPAHQAATNDTTPALSAKAIDGDGGQVRLDYEVRRKREGESR
ncbi:DNRLRE domain-containing protein [Streptomyces anulatus]|uniref:DNRLRE domain-containing protein n=1 Tax=Streptomyces anulatus TaxID=1892 RepID=UPI00364973F7